MSQLVKIGLPSQQAQGARNAKRLQQIIDQRAAAVARIDAEFNARVKAMVAEMSEDVAPAVAESDAVDAPAVPA